MNRKDGPFLDATLENVEQSLNNSFGHGPCVYEMYRGLLQFLTKSTFRTWFELDSIFYGGNGLPEDSIMGTNIGIITGTAPKVLERYGVQGGRLKRVKRENEEIQYWNEQFLKKALLDTKGIITKDYQCNCRYECEKELDKRISQVEANTGVPREFFLPFLNQKEGTRILGRAVSRVE